MNRLFRLYAARKRDKNPPRPILRNTDNVEEGRESLKPNRIRSRKSLRRGRKRSARDD